MSPFANQRTPPGHTSTRQTSHSTTLYPMSGQTYHGYPSSSPAPGYGPGPPNPSDPWPQQTRNPYSYTGASVRPSFPGPSDQYSSAMHGRPFYPATPSWLMADYQGRFPQHQTQGTRSNFSPGFRHGLPSPQYLCPPPGSLSGFATSLPHPPTYFIGRSHPYQGGNTTQNSSGPHASGRHQNATNSAPTGHHHSQTNCLNNYLSSSMCEMQMMAANMFATMNMSSSSNHMSSSFSHSSVSAPQTAVHSRHSSASNDYSSLNHMTSFGHATSVQASQNSVSSRHLSHNNDYTSLNHMTSSFGHAGAAPNSVHSRHSSNSNDYSSNISPATVNVNGSNNSNHGSGSRCSSVASNHGMTSSSSGPPADNTSCSFNGYNSPSNSVHAYSPYPQGGNTSHTPTPNAAVSAGPPAVADNMGFNSNGYVSSGSGTSSATSYPVINASNSSNGPRVTPPSSNYSTPPVSGSQGIPGIVPAPGEDSSHSLHSHFPLTPQSGSSYYSSSSGYSSKCSTDSASSAPGSVGSSNGSTSCMVAAAAAVNGYSSHGISSESSMNERSQSSCMSSGHSMDPGAVCITGGEAVANLSSVFAEQEIDLPSINYEGSDEALVPSDTREKRKKSSGKEKRKKREKAKQAAVADRLVQAFPFDVPVPGLTNHFIPSLLPFNHPNDVMNNPYAMTGSMMHRWGPHDSHGASAISTQVSATSSAPCYASTVPPLNNTDLTTHNLSAAQHIGQPNIPASVSQGHVEMPSQPSHPDDNSQTSLHSSTATVEHVADKVSFAELEDDLRLLTEGSSSIYSSTRTSEQTEAQVNHPQIGVQSETAEDQNESIHSFQNHGNCISQETIQNERHQRSSSIESHDHKSFDNVTVLNSANSIGVGTQSEEMVIKDLKSSSTDNVQTYGCGSSNTTNSVSCGTETEPPPKKKKRKVKEEVSNDKKTPKTKRQRKSQVEIVTSPSTALSKNSPAANGDPSASGDSKFFKNRPQHPEIKIEAVVPKATTAKSTKKRKQTDNSKINPSTKLHDEYEFQESPSEPLKKKGKKSNPATASATKSNKKVVEKASVPALAQMTSPIQVPTPSRSKNTPSVESSNKGSKSPTVSEKRDPQSKSQKSPGVNVMNGTPSKKESKSLKSKEAQVKKENSTPKEAKESSLSSVPPQQKPQPLKTNHNQTAPPKIDNKSQVSPHSASKKVQQSKGNLQSAATNTPRRRSSDKKALTIKEGLMRTGDFVVSHDEMHMELPMIWRIEGKSLLQRFQPTQQDGNTVYVNTSSYSAWNPTVKQKFHGVDVRIVGCSRTKITVEKLGLTKSNPSANQNGDVAIVEKSRPPPLDGSIYQHQENFEVFIQTLISQSLDPNFIAEIIKEKDDYFLTHVQAIDDVCTQKKARFCSKIKWDTNVIRCIENFPSLSVVPLKNEHDLRCRLCNDNWSSYMFTFSGDPYDPQTLEIRDPVDIKQTKHAACESCRDRVILFSRLHHSKYHFFLRCQKKVEEMRTLDETKESHIILEECLQDNDWIQILFDELQDIWGRIR